jgi:hypothetical protein
MRSSRKLGIASVLHIYGARHVKRAAGHYTPQPRRFFVEQLFVVSTVGDDLANLFIVELHVGVCLVHVGSGFTEQLFIIAGFQVVATHAV